MMSELEIKVLTNISKALPHLTELEQSRVLGFSEGLTYKTNTNKEEEQEEEE